MTEEWRKPHNEELNDLYSSPYIRVIKLRRIRWAGHAARIGRDAYGVLLGKPEGKGPLGRPKRKWEDNTKMDLQEVALEGNQGHVLPHYLCTTYFNIFLPSSPRSSKLSLAFRIT